ncbi:MAG: p-hydroxycinnamoyl CoA hydratase/lyase [Deltaproteobacteria bacterium]|nr:p-hydroxycinnamoyl CoA hydratase/lyase [Deltaproteobacteria bacterium]
MSDYKTILVEKKEGVATITFNRPKVKNCMNPQMHLDMVDALTELEDDDEVRVLVLTGAGDSFCAGQDLKEYFYEIDDNPKARRRAREAATTWRSHKLRLFPKPTLGAVNGWCFGGAFSIVAACDIVIAADEAVFGLSEVNFGKFPGGMVTKDVNDMFHPRDALFYIFTGRKFDGKQAAAMKFVNYSVPREKLMGEVYALADELKAKHPEVLRIAKEAYKYGKRFNYEEAYAFSTAKTRELDYVAGKTWKQGFTQFKKREMKPGLGTYKWDKE